jgi:integrase
VFKRKDGKWCGKWRDADGKWRYLYRRTKAEAKTALREALRDRDDRITPADKLTLNDALDAWLDGMLDNVSVRTWTNRESLVRLHIKGHAIGARMVCKLTPEHLRGFYRDGLNAGLSPSTVGRLHAAIKGACKECVRSKHLRHNPADDVKPPKMPSKDMDVLTAEQVRRLLDAVRGNRYEVIIVLGATCALRIGEALSIRYEDLNLTAGTISIRRTLWRGNVSPPKTPASRATLKLPTIALEALRRHCEAHDNPTEGCNGTPVSAGNFHHWGWKPALRRSGLDEGLHFHNLRHGVASLLLNQNVPVPVVSRFLRHSNPSITMRVYAHIIDGTSGMAADAMGDAIG